MYTCHVTLSNLHHIQICICMDGLCADLDTVCAAHACQPCPVIITALWAPLLAIQKQGRMQSCVCHHV